MVLLGYGASQLLRYVRAHRPELTPVLTPLIVGYFVFAIGTIVSYPLFNLFLLLDRFGRHTLQPSQKTAAVFFGVSLIPGVGFLVLWGWGGGAVFQACAILWGLQVIPVAIAGMKSPGSARTILIVGASLLAVLAIGLTASFGWGWRRTEHSGVAAIGVPAPDPAWARRRSPI